MNRRFQGRSFKHCVRGHESVSLSTMTRTPPLPPDEILRRVLRLASLDGRALLYLAGFFAVLSAAGRDAAATIAGCLAAGAGALELHGVNLLRQGTVRGMSWLIRSQLLLLATVLLFAAYRLSTFDVEAIRAQLPHVQAAMKTWWPDDAVFQQGVKDLFSDEARLLASCRSLHELTYILVGAVTLLYQGGMARYYARRSASVTQALGPADDPPSA
jgi:hypothetical protein